MSVCKIQLLLAPSTIISLPWHNPNIILNNVAKIKERCADFEGTPYIINNSFYFLLVSLVNQVNHDFYHHILLLCFALGNHQGQGYEGVVCQSLRTILAIEYTIIIEEPKEQRGSNALVTIAERVVS